MKLGYSYLEKSFLCILIAVFSFYLTDCLAKIFQVKRGQMSISSYCDDSLEWYDDHPGYKGEFSRVLDYCIKYVKDISPEEIMQTQFYLILEQ